MTIHGSYSKLLSLYSLFSNVLRHQGNNLLFWQWLESLCSLHLAWCQVHREQEHVRWMTEWLFSNNNTPCSHCCPCWHSWRNTPFLLPGGWRKIQSLWKPTEYETEPLSMNHTLPEVTRNYNPQLWPWVRYPALCSSLDLVWIQEACCVLPIFWESVSLCKGLLIQRGKNLLLPPFLINSSSY